MQAEANTQTEKRPMVLDTGVIKSQTSAKRLKGRERGGEKFMMKMEGDKERWRWLLLLLGVTKE